MEEMRSGGQGSKNGTRNRQRGARNREWLRRAQRRERKK